MIIFAGSRAGHFETDVYYWYVGGNQTFQLPLLLSYCNHSPTGFEWGYGGSGPAQLAWVILYMTLLDVEGMPREVAKAKADLYHQGYKWQAIAGLPHDGWQIGAQSVLDWLSKQGYNPSTNLD